MRNFVVHAHVFALALALSSGPVQAQHYSVSFNATGASDVVDSVRVENITTGKSLILAGNEILSLYPDVPTGIDPHGRQPYNSLIIYPNPFSREAYFEFTPSCPGKTVIDIYDISGKCIYRESFDLDMSPQKFSLSGPGTGIYLIKATGINYQYPGKLVSINPDQGSIRLVRLSNVSLAAEGDMREIQEIKEINEIRKRASESPGILYNAGDRLQFIGYSGAYATLVMAEPVSDTAITFEFVPCTDGDNNNYKVVKIGTQTWMAENLRTTRFNDGVKIPNVKDAASWRNTTFPAYCSYDNQPYNLQKYGALYNWQAVSSDRVCPRGWHLPVTGEISALTGYMEKRVSGNESTDENTAKSLAAYSGWETSVVTGTIGNEQWKNNSSGFSADPGGLRSADLDFAGIKQLGSWWVKNENGTASSFTLKYNSTKEYVYQAGMQDGHYVKCIRNSEADSAAMWTRRAKVFIEDGNTVAWFKSDDLSTLTRDGQNRVSRWNDRLGSGHDLLQDADSKKPVWTDSGVLFDGIGQMMKTAPFNYNSPEYMYLLFKQLSYNREDYIIDGNTGDSALLCQGYGNADLAMYGGLGEATSYSRIGRFIIVKCFYSGKGDGKLQVNNNPPVPVASCSNMGGITIGSGASGNRHFSNILLKEAIFRTSPLGENEIYNYLYNTTDFEFNENNFNSGKLVFTWDDMSLSQYKTGYPLFMSKGIKATHYVISDRIGTAGYPTWQNLSEMYHNGMDMQCHSTSHLKLTELTQEQVIAELQGNNEAFTSNGLPVPLHFAYPFGANNAFTKAWISGSGLRRTARVSYPMGFVLKNSDRYLLGPYWIDNLAPTASGIKKVKELIGHAGFYREALILGGHMIDAVQSEYTVSAAALESILDFARSRGIDVITMSELSEMMDP